MKWRLHSDGWFWRKRRAGDNQHSDDYWAEHNKVYARNKDAAAKADAEQRP